MYFKMERCESCGKHVLMAKSQGACRACLTTVSEPWEQVVFPGMLMLAIVLACILA